MQIKWSMIPVALIAILGITAAPMFGQETKAADQDKKEEKKTDVQDEGDDQEDDSNDEEELTLGSVQKEYNKAYSAFMKAYRAEKDPAEKRKIVAEMLPKKDDYIEKIFKIVDADPASEDSWKALNWLNAGLRTSAARKKVMEAILEHHIESEELGSMAMMMSRELNQETIENLKKIVEKNPHDDVQGKATYAMVSHFGMLKRYLDNEEIMERIKAAPGSDDLFAYLSGLKKEEVTKKVDELIKTIKEKYADVEYRGKITLGDKAEAYVFERDRLQIDMEVPEIQAEDVDGAEFKLSEYRGKVVFLDFWGDW